jgi:hypothetical protein
MKNISFIFTSFFLAATAFSADWTLIYAHKSGVKWYSSNAVKLNDGTIRLFIKGVHQKKDSTPFAILLDCNAQNIRNFVAGNLGSDFYQPWQPITPDSVGEIAFDAYCKTPNAKNLGSKSTPIRKDKVVPNSIDGNGGKESIDLSTTHPVENTTESDKKQVQTPSFHYAAKVANAVRPNIGSVIALAPNLIAEYAVYTNDSGTIVSIKPVNLSGDAYWDEVALNAIAKTERLPRDDNGKFYSPFVISLQSGR